MKRSNFISFPLADEIFFLQPEEAESLVRQVGCIYPHFNFRPGRAGGERGTRLRAPPQPGRWPGTAPPCSSPICLDGSLCSNSTAGGKEKAPKAAGLCAGTAAGDRAGCCRRRHRARFPSVPGAGSTVALTRGLPTRKRAHRAASGPSRPLPGERHGSGRCSRCLPS